jgi:hypothetical protein
MPSPVKRQRTPFSSAGQNSHVRTADRVKLSRILSLPSVEAQEQSNVVRATLTSTASRPTSLSLGKEKGKADKRCITSVGAKVARHVGFLFLGYACQA